MRRYSKQKLSLIGPAVMIALSLLFLWVKSYTYDGWIDAVLIVVWLLILATWTGILFVRMRIRQYHKEAEGLIESQLEA